MHSTALLVHLHNELDDFRACLNGDLSVRIEHCGRWTLHDLTEHVGGLSLWASAAVREGRGDRRGAQAPREREALVAWFEETSRTLVEALDTDPATGAWTFLPPRTVGFWQRRLSLEFLVHLWDAQRALGAARPLDPELAGEGVAEVFDTMAPGQVRRGRAPAPQHTLRLEATDLGAAWTYGPGTTPAATLAATAQQLLLLLWGRMSPTGEGFVWSGDRRAGLEVLAGPLTP